ncbi:uncharacterized protein F4807DRAFT_414279 [Annulohypoxylon truncatum]|uniref:uncharacterized protein n=1 Tax=Annulohypoxylon truncatum TaxID=327061 RepID=UPI0020077E06|nr:uncharacterized protein F4807DRAFT_414279 [Annulohypoxylon truncatum]KAI1212737.1 hypothetical protein F4807DRAFT_414279 [Annulohypoxylon truncatum]
MIIIEFIANLNQSLGDHLLAIIMSSSRLIAAVCIAPLSPFPILLLTCIIMSWQLLIIRILSLNGCS